MKLRPYQAECLEEIRRRGPGRWLCQLATGMGKTVIFSRIPIRRHTLILSHRDELVHQPLKYFECATAVEMGKESVLCPSAYHVVSASVQSMARRKENYARDWFDTVIVDEAHHAAAKQYREVLDYFRADTVIGFTATPNRADELGLETVFDEIIYDRDLKWGIEHGYLSPIVAKRVNIGYDLRHVATRLGDYAQGELARAVNVDGCNKAIAEAVSNAPMPALVFAVDVKHAENLADAICGHMGEGTAVALSAASKDRAEVIQAYRDGKVKVLVNCALFTEGTDLPDTRTVVIARPTKSTALYTQMVGRGTRLAPGKTHCTLIDCVGVTKVPLCTAPTLIGLEPDMVPERYETEVEGDLLEDIPAIMERVTDTPENWVRNLQDVDLWARGLQYNMHDVAYYRDIYGDLKLRLPSGLWIQIAEPDKLGNSSMATSTGFDMFGPAQQIFDAAYVMLRGDYKDEHPLWVASSRKRWGRKPATDKQKQYIMRLNRGRYDLSQVMPTLTKAQGIDIINRLTEGR